MSVLIGERNWDTQKCQFIYSAKKNYLLIETYIRNKIVHRLYFKDVTENIANYLFEQITLREMGQVLTSEMEIL